MATVAQIYNIVNATARECWGENAITVKDTPSFISLGNETLSSQSNTDVFTKTLVDRIGKTVFSTRPYEVDEPDVVRKPFEYGCILQKIYVEMPEARVNNSWNIGEPGYTPEFAPVIKPSVKQKLFSKIATWEIGVTIPDAILKTAFLNETAMAVFIDAIFTSMDNMLKIALENNINLTRASFIARKLNAGNTCGAINLLAGYNALTGESLTVSAALRNVDFLKYAARQIKLWSDRVTKMSVLFNDEEYKRHTPKSMQVLDILADFSTSTDTYLQSDTYHNELTKLPLYNVVPYWQGSGTGFDFNDTSAVKIKIDDNTNVEQSGVIGTLFDREALGVTITERRSSTERNNHDEYTNYYNKVNIGYFNDMSENGIVFYLAET